MSYNIFIKSLQASVHGELSVRRGETVDVLEESSPSRWQVKNRMGGTGFVPTQLLEVVIKKKPKSKLARPSYGPMGVCTPCRISYY